MEHLGNGLILIANGAWTIVTAIVHPTVLGVLVLIGACAWLAQLEIDEVDRSASKPLVDRH
jgi:hypothetical protein